MKNVLDRHTFIKIINAMEEKDAFQRDLYDLFSGNSLEAPEFPSLEYELTTALNVMFEQDSDDVYGTDIEYFIYELEFGKKWKPGCLTYKDEDIDLSDAGKLYDWITRFNNDKEREQDTENE